MSECGDCASHRQVCIGSRSLTLSVACSCLTSLSPLLFCSASLWTRSGMATLAAKNVAAILSGHPVWDQPNDVLVFVDGDFDAIPKAAPSIVNAKELNL